MYLIHPTGSNARELCIYRSSNNIKSLAEHVQQFSTDARRSRTTLHSPVTSVLLGKNPRDKETFLYRVV